ncbi:MAG: hypothetical protein OXI51_08295 [Chloroflexota bacterium]|nr:hypothetical protein [Chloroflexota bacterium]
MLPTGTAAAEVRAPSGKALAGRFDGYRALGGAHEAHEAPLAGDFAAGDAGALRLTTGDCHGGPQWIRPE